MLFRAPNKSVARYRFFCIFRRIILKNYRGLSQLLSARDTSLAVRPLNVRSITDTIACALASAGLDTRSGPMKGVTDTIHQALSAAGLNERGDAPILDDAADQGIACKTGTPIAPTAPVLPARPGQFVSRSFTNNAGTRAYKLYVPAAYAGEAGAAAP